MKRGFSLFEVLIVICIIAVLALLLFPAAGAVRTKAKEVGCASNLRQLYIAMKLYEQDYGDYPPSNASFPAFKAYYPTILECPASNRRMQRPSDDYLMLGQMIIVGVVNRYTMEERRRALGKCREIRAGSIPLVMDSNHMPVSLSAEDSASRCLLIRENGSLDQLTMARYIAAPAVCDKDIVADVFNK